MGLGVGVGVRGGGLLSSVLGGIEVYDVFADVNTPMILKDPIHIV